MTKDARQGRKADDRLLLSSPQGVRTLAVNEPSCDPSVGVVNIHAKGAATVNLTNERSGVAVVNATKDASTVIADGTVAINPTKDSAALGGSVNGDYNGVGNAGESNRTSGEGAVTNQPIASDNLTHDAISINADGGGVGGGDSSGGNVVSALANGRSSDFRDSPLAGTIVRVALAIEERERLLGARDSGGANEGDDFLNLPQQSGRGEG